MIIDLRKQPDEKNHIEGRARFDIIRYANCWEDSSVLFQALQPTAGSRILSIASAGDNTLDLLACGAEVVAVDLSRPQLACLELRVVAFRHLEYDDVLRFLGIHTSATRLSTYRDLRASLSDISREYWDAHTSVIDNGVIFGGKFEDYFSHFRQRVIPLIHPRRIIDEMLAEKTEEERRRFYDDVWNSRRWRLLFRIFFSRRVMGWLGRDPEFFRYVQGPVSTEILRRAERALKGLPTHDNPYLTFILRGNFHDALPPYLQPSRFEAIRDGLDRLTLCRGIAEDAARHFSQGGFDGFNLSDIFEYLDEETTRNVFSVLLDFANDGARFAYWNMMVPRRASILLPQRLTYLETLSRDLHQQDRAFFYGDFVVEEATS